MNKWPDKPLRLSEDLRVQLSKPIGTLIRGSEEDLSQAVKVIAENLSQEKPQLIVTVGDIVAKSFNEAGLKMDIAVVDFHVKRTQMFKNLSEIGFTKTSPDIIVENPKGTLTPESFAAVEKALENVGKNPPFVIRVIGEEDLVTLVVILAAPLGTHVFYGQPNEGIVQVIVTESKKSEVHDIVSQFSS